MSREDGRLVVITGAAGGIGLAIARQFAEQGRSVVLCDQNEVHLRRRVESVSFAVEPALFGLDLRDIAAVEEFTAEVKKLGTVGVLVNNAAFQHDGDVISSDVSDFDDSYFINLRAPFLLCRAFAPDMRDSGGGSIVNISSVHALAAGPARVAYASMKAGLLGLTRSMACDLGKHNIRVNAVIPSATRTSALERAWTEERGMNSKVRKDFLEWASDQHPQKRIGEIEDVVEAVAFLAECSFISGESIRVDGGLLSSLRLLPPEDF